MKEFILNNRITLLGLLIGSVIGGAYYMSLPVLKKHRVVYEYNLQNDESISACLKSDTFFTTSIGHVRSFYHSHADTLIDQGVKRSELIFYQEQEYSVDLVESSILSPLSQNKTSVLTVRVDGEKRNSTTLLAFPLLGLFLGYLVGLVVARLKPTKQDNKTPI